MRPLPIMLSDIAFSADFALKTLLHRHLECRREEKRGCQVADSDKGKGRLIGLRKPFNITDRYSLLLTKLWSLANVESSLLSLRSYANIFNLPFHLGKGKYLHIGGFRVLRKMLLKSGRPARSGVGGI